MDRNSIEIAGRKIGVEHPPYIVAELSANHNGDLGNALQLIELAKQAGADAVKIQTYRPDTITIDSKNPEFQIRGGLWDGHSLFELYQKAHTPWDWHADLFTRASDVGITLFSSPFDDTAVELLEELQAPAYKIASFEAIDLPLIARVAETGKPLIISTGMSSRQEIAEAIECARDHGADEIAILHCVSSYPAPAEDYNLKTIPDMIEEFAVPVGLSDHTLGNVTAIGAIALGACIVEKHLTLDRTRGGADDSFSIEPDEMRQLCQDVQIAAAAMGKVHYGPVESDSGNIQFRRSLFVVSDVRPGEIFSADNVRSIRPGNGLAPKNLPDVLGKRAACALPHGTALKWEFIKD